MTKFSDHSAAPASASTGVNPVLFTWLEADGDPVRQPLRLAALQSFPLLSAMATMLKPADMATIEQAIDNGKALPKALASVLKTTEAVIMEAGKVHPNMLGEARVERLLRSYLKAAAAIPVAHLPGCGGIRPDIEWQAFVDTCQIAGIGADGLVGIESLAATPAVWKAPDAVHNGSFQKDLHNVEELLYGVYDRVIMPNVAALSVAGGAEDCTPADCEAILNPQEAAHLLWSRQSFQDLKTLAEQYERDGGLTWAAARRLSRQHRQWAAMTAPVDMPDLELSVVPITSVDELEGLIPDLAKAAAFADACLKGLKQVVAVVTPAGDTVAVAYMSAEEPERHRIELRVGDIVMLTTAQPRDRITTAVRAYADMVNRRHLKVDLAKLTSARMARMDALAELDGFLWTYDHFDNEVADRFFDTWRLFLAPEHRRMSRMEWLEATGIAAWVRAYNLKNGYGSTVH